MTRSLESITSQDLARTTQGTRKKESRKMLRLELAKKINTKNQDLINFRKGLFEQRKESTVFFYQTIVSFITINMKVVGTKFLYNI